MCSQSTSKAGVLKISFSGFQIQSLREVGFAGAGGCKHPAQLARGALARIMRGFIGTTPVPHLTPSKEIRSRAQALNQVMVSNGSAAPGAQNLY